MWDPDQDKESKEEEENLCLRRPTFYDELHEALLLHECVREAYGVRQNEDLSYSIVDLEKITGFEDHVKDALRKFLKVVGITPLEPRPDTSDIVLLSDTMPPNTAGAKQPVVIIAGETRKRLDDLYKKIDELPKHPYKHLTPGGV